MDKDSTVIAEALLQSPGSQALDDPISLDVQELIQASSNTTRSKRVRKRDHSSTGSSAEKPPRSKSRMASSQVADGVRSDQSQGGPFSVPLTVDEEQARQDRRDAVDGASTQAFCKMTEEKQGMARF